jgi:hypothetical protein
MMFLTITGLIYLSVIILGFVLLSARFKKTYVIKRGKLIARFSMEKRKRFENDAMNLLLGGYRVVRVKGFVGARPYNLHVEVK